MKKRRLSPSSINTYRQCPRKFYYQYILRLPTKPSIHLVRGSIVHDVLEKFFSIDLDSIDEQDYKFGFRSFLFANLVKQWKLNKQKFDKLPMNNSDIELYLVESQQMLYNFVDLFCEKLEEEMKKTPDFKSAFRKLTPRVEERIESQELSVLGFIDAIHQDEKGITILDYKTSKKDTLTPEYRLQLGIYALLYKEKYDVQPYQVGINFLKFGEQTIDVDKELLDEAKTTILFTHEQTKYDEIKYYDKKTSPLCKWSSGQCDFYEECMKN